MAESPHGSTCGSATRTRAGSRAWRAGTHDVRRRRRRGVRGRVRRRGAARRRRADDPRDAPRRCPTWTVLRHRRLPRLPRPRRRVRTGALVPHPGARRDGTVTTHVLGEGDRREPRPARRARCRPCRRRRRTCGGRRARARRARRPRCDASVGSTTAASRRRSAPSGPARSTTAGPTSSDDVARLERSPRFTHVATAGVWGVQRLPDGGVRIATDREDLPTLEADAVVVATGANERVVPFPGWDLPGVLTVGGAQALLKGQGMRPGRAVVVAGAGPLLLPVAAALARVRTRIVALTDANDPLAWLASPRGLRLAKVREGAEHLATLARHRVRLRAAHRGHRRPRRRAGRGGRARPARARLDAHRRERAHRRRRRARDVARLRARHRTRGDARLPARHARRVRAGGRRRRAAGDERRGRVGRRRGHRHRRRGRRHHEGRVAGLAAARALGGRSTTPSSSAPSRADVPTSRSCARSHGC
jgi:hypothetical protein